jgi:hypothetical protein
MLALIHIWERSQRTRNQTKPESTPRRPPHVVHPTSSTHLYHLYSHRALLQQRSRMSELRESSPPTPGELAALRKVIALTEPQISTTGAIISTLSEELEKTNEERRRLEAELATRRQSLLEWTQPRDLLSKALKSLDSRVQSRPHVAHIREGAANPTAMPSDDELAQTLVEQDNNGINASRVSMDTRESTISILRSRIAVLEEDIAGCKRVSSHTKSMIALQASHKDQLQDQLAQHKSRFHPLIRLPDTCLRDIFLHVVQLSWEKWERDFYTVVAPDDIRFTGYSSDPMFALTAVCHRWRMVATHQPELWSKFVIFAPPTRTGSRLAHYIRLLQGRELSILIIPMFWGDGDIQSLEIIESSTVKLDTLILLLFGDRYLIAQAMEVLPSPRILILRDFVAGFLPTPIPREFLSRTEELCTFGCHMIPPPTVPTLQRLELFLEHIKPLSPPISYISALLRNLHRLHYLSIRCQTTRAAPTDPQLPELLISPGVCESVTHLQIPVMALCGPLSDLQIQFTLPNLVRLSLLKFLQEGSNLQSWKNFCLLNGGKINRLDLDADPTAIRKIALSPAKLGLNFFQHLYYVVGIKYLSLHACIMRSLLLALLVDVRMIGEGGDSLLVPNMKIFEICHVNEAAVRASFEEALGSWNEARNIKQRDEATGQHDIAMVLWT